MGFIGNDFIQETCIADFNQACDTIHCNNGNDKLQACLLSDCHSSDVPEGNLILILQTSWTKDQCSLVWLTPPLTLLATKADYF